MSKEEAEPLLLQAESSDGYEIYFVAKHFSQ